MRDSMTTVAVLAGLGLIMPAAHADGPKVGMQGWLFTPKVLTVKVGERVTWVNNDDSHHVVFFEGPAAKNNSSDLKPDKEHSVVFDQPGEYKYYCKYHKDYGMVGTVVVKAATAGK